MNDKVVPPGYVFDLERLLRGDTDAPRSAVFTKGDPAQAAMLESVALDRAVDYWRRIRAIQVLGYSEEVATLEGILRDSRTGWIVRKAAALCLAALGSYATLDAVLRDKEMTFDDARCAVAFAFAIREQYALLKRVLQDNRATKHLRDMAACTLHLYKRSSELEEIIYDDEVDTLGRGIALQFYTGICSEQSAVALVRQQFFIPLVCKMAAHKRLRPVPPLLYLHGLPIGKQRRNAIASLLKQLIQYGDKESTHFMRDRYLLNAFVPNDQRSNDWAWDISRDPKVAQIGSGLIPESLDSDVRAEWIADLQSELAIELLKNPRYLCDSEFDFAHTFGVLKGKLRYLRKRIRENLRGEKVHISNGERVVFVSDIDVPVSSLSLTEQLADAERIEGIRQALAWLDERDLELINLRFREDRTYREIGEDYLESYGKRAEREIKRILDDILHLVIRSRSSKRF